MNDRDRAWQRLTGQRPISLSQRRQGEQYEQHVRNGNDAVHNNPQQR